MPTKFPGRGPLTRQAVRDALARFYSVRSRLTARDALNGCGLSGTEELRAHGITEQMEKERFGGPSSFFQNVNCGSGVIRR